MDFARPALFVRRVLALAIAAAALHLAAPGPDGRLAAQAPGRIVGRVIDPATGAPVAGAVVEIPGTGIATQSAIDGRYTLLGVAPGTVTLYARKIGHRPKTITGLQMPDGGAVEQDIALAVEVIELESITVSAVQERGTVAQALSEQRRATGIINAVTAEQITRSPDSDAGQAVQRVSGVSVQDGRYVLVRGLGERYTTTSLNSARLPSPEPERKIVPLDLFPSGLLQSIVTSKTFTPDQPGDFTGAQVDLKTREFPLHRALTLSASLGYSDAVTAQTVARAPTTGTEWLGFAGGERQLPAAARDAGDLSGLTQTDVNDIVASFRHVWSPARREAPPNASFAVSLGGEDPVLGHPVGYIASLTYSLDQEVRRDEQRAIAIYGGVADSTLPQNVRTGTTGGTSVLWGGMANVTTRLGAYTKLSFNNTYTRSAENRATQLAGFFEEDSRDFVVARLDFIERSVRSNQLAGEHLLGERHTLAWSVTSAGVTRAEPDRSDIRYEAVIATGGGQATPTAWWGQYNSAVRTFAQLDESSWNLESALTLRLGRPDRPLQMKAGGALRTTDRSSDTRAFEHRNLTLSDSARAQAPEQIFTDANAYSSAFFLSADANQGRYAVSDLIGAGFVQLELAVSDRVRLIGGARVERWDLDMDVTRVTGATQPVSRRYTDVLPALGINVTLGASQVLRLSASQTLSRPEYRELADIYWRDVYGDLPVFGNPDLRRALIQNYDVRWEWYPNPGEILSVGAFAKRFDDPIEKVIVPQTGADGLTFVNADGATNYGVELEVRKQRAPFTLFANATLMRSRIQPGVATLTSSDRPMVGQSPYVVNVGLAYTHPGGRLNTTLLYNVVGERIVEAGSLPRPDAYEHARHVVDFSLQAPVTATMALRFDARNLLDAPHHITQGSVTRLRYTTGRVFSLGVAWRPGGAP